MFGSKDGGSKEMQSAGASCSLCRAGVSAQLLRSIVPAAARSWGLRMKFNIHEGEFFFTYYLQLLHSERKSHAESANLSSHHPKKWRIQYQKSSLLGKQEGGGFIRPENVPRKEATERCVTWQNSLIRMLGGGGAMINSTGRGTDKGILLLTTREGVTT